MNRKSFTLIEAVVAIAILSVITSTLYIAFKRALDIWERSEEKLVIYQTAREALDTMSRGFAGATRFPGDDEAIWGNDQMVVFTAIVDGEIKKVTYDISGNSFSATVEDWVKYWTAPASPPSGDGSGSFEYWGFDTTTWKPAGEGGTPAGNSWEVVFDSTSYPRQYLPKAVKVNLAIEHQGVIKNFEFVVTLPMQWDLSNPGP
ncbi:MAG: prepilin-type N-terminal cleavage/methylation domain-containing protein [Candidatus Omnitrophica bacterium]|nr:prepilin-type N-terminal cleavage/methylation domain-containing protein [Candidatus Omnitrophota bacterium]